MYMRLIFPFSQVDEDLDINTLMDVITRSKHELGSKLVALLIFTHIKTGLNRSKFDKTQSLLPPGA